MHFVLTPLGSAGDVYPFLWIGSQLAERGHAVTVVTSSRFEPEVRGARLAFRALGAPEEYERLTRHPDLWHPTRAIRLVGGVAGAATGDLFDAIAEVTRGKPAVLVGSLLSLGTRLAREKLGLPLATVHLQPACFVSVHETPVLFAGLEWFTRLPRPLKRLALALPNPMDRSMRRGVAAACRREGIAAPRSVVRDWIHSPDLVLGLFPEWFAAPQPDWPASTHLTGFPLADQRDLFPIRPELRAFLDAGPPPVVITAGSAMRQGENFFAAAIGACGQLGRRMVIATSHPEQVARPLPANAFLAEYAPFGVLLPGTAAFLNHGGIGTVSQGLGAGVPQLILPMSHDQPDNANRLRRLGTGDFLYRRDWTPDRIAARLDLLMRSRDVRAACETAAARCREARAAEIVVAQLERLARPGGVEGTGASRRTAGDR